MSDMEINIRFNHAGEFKSKNYVGGMCMVVTRVEVDTFSYTVLMEFVRDYLHYTEIGGVYSKMTKGGWQLISNDKDLMDIVAGCKHGEEIDLYVDNTVDKDIEPLNQMQPHVTVRPRNNLVQVSAKKQLKRKFVTTHQLQQKQLQQLKITRKSPRLCGRSEEAPVVKDMCGTSTGEAPTVRDKVTARKKLDLHTGPSEGERTEENEVHKPPLTKYEKERISHLKENHQKLESLGIRPLVASLNASAGQDNKKRKNGDGKDHDKDHDEDEEYNPEKEDDGESDNSAEEIAVVQKKRPVQGPRTRSRTNAAVVEKDFEKYLRKDGVENAKKVGTSKSRPVLKPTCSKNFQQANMEEAPGSINAYLAMRDRQKQNIEIPTTPHEVPELNLEEPEAEVVKSAPRKPRGRTKMAKVHARRLAEKILITLNEDHQPVSDNQKIITELTNFVGSLARDNVSLTYVNWHVVPDKLKKELWEYTRDRYIIPDEGQKWVYSTLNDAWRGYKSRMKTKHYSNLPNDDERMAKRPDDIPLEDFKTLLKFWADEHVQKIARDNTASRCSIIDTHTMGPKSLAQFKHKMKIDDPEHAEPSDAKVFVETRERKKGREYKINTKVLETKITNLKKLLSSGQQDEADALVSHDKEHGRTWLVGRGGKASGVKDHAPSDRFVQELATKIKLDLEQELESKVNKKVQENMAWVLKKLGDANPGLKLDIGDYCPASSSEHDENGTPMTQDGATS